MKVWLWLLGGAGIGWLATCPYLVESNERAIVRVCGQVQRDSAGKPDLKASGLWFTWPWPLATIDRLRLNETQTLSIGLDAAPETNDVDAFLQPVAAGTKSQFLTGDRNVLNLQITVQYRVSEQHADDYLFQSDNAAKRLSARVESIAADLVSRSGADFVHPLGLGLLREMLTRLTRDAAVEMQLGVEVEDVSISSVSPPIRVKRDFLDVSNARADREKYIHAANAYAEQQLASARAEADGIVNEAQAYRQQKLGEARGEAASFEELVTKLQQFGNVDDPAYQEARSLALSRRYLDTMQSILQRVAAKVFLDSGKPVDITIFRDPRE